MKARLLMLFVLALVGGVVGFGRAGSADRFGPRLDRAAAGEVGLAEVGRFIECSREDPCGPGFVCRSGKCVPKK
jgi:hypothetical protein